MRKAPLSFPKAPSFCHTNLSPQEAPHCHITLRSESTSNDQNRRHDLPFLIYSTSAPTKKKKANRKEEKNWWQTNLFSVVIFSFGCTRGGDPLLFIFIVFSLSLSLNARENNKANESAKFQATIGLLRDFRTLLFFFFDSGRSIVF
ncbi:hypothetical protein QOT17_012904 [Balamuthia mandrillaris]